MSVFSLTLVLCTKYSWLTKT